MHLMHHSSPCSSDCGTRSPPGGTKRRAPERKEPHKEKEKGVTRTVCTQNTRTIESTAPTFDRTCSSKGVFSMAHSFARGRTWVLLHKGEFRNALCLRYGWNLRSTPTLCNCGTSFSVDHAMTCHMGGIPTIRHNEIRDITATLLTEICHNVAIESLLQPLTNESFAHRSSNTEPNARLDIRARGFWNTGQDAFFDVSFFLPKRV